MRNPFRRDPPDPRASRGQPAGQRLTRRQLSRHQREQRFRRYLLIALGSVLGLIVVIWAFGYWRENIFRANQPVAVVNGEAISTQQYARLLGFRQSELSNQLNQLMMISSQVPAEQDQPSPFQEQISQLQQELSMLQTSYLDALIDDRLLRREAASLGVTVSPADVEAAVMLDFQPPLTPTPLPGQPTAVVVATPAAAPTVAASRLQETLDRTKLMSEAEYRDWIVEARLYRNRVRDIVASDVITTETQVHARHILVESQEAALQVLERLRAGEDFAAVANEVSTEQTAREPEQRTGGDLGWFGSGDMVPAFEQAAFSLPVGQLSEPVQTDFGFHIIEVIERQDARPLAAAQVEAAKDQKLREWLDQQRERASTEGRLTTDLTPDKLEWINTYLTDHFRGLQPAA